MKIKRLLILRLLSIQIVLLVAITLCSCTGSGNKCDDNISTEIDKRVKGLLSQMTIEEKVAQIRMFHAKQGEDVISLDEDNNLVMSEMFRERLANGIAGIKNPGEFETPKRAAILNNKLQQYIIENNRLGIPALFVTESYNGVDAEGCTRFGRPISLSSTWNTELVNQVYDCMGREARLRGLHMTHSPVADIARDPRFGRMSESFGEDTHLVTEMIVSAVKGLQGDYEGLSSTHIGAVTKHFAGYTQVAGGRNFASVEISPRTLQDEIFPPFKAAVQRGRTIGMMAAHGDINGVACHGSRELLTNILRKQWGFNGYVVSDANDVGRLSFFMKVAETPEEAVRIGLEAGVDVDLYGNDAYALLPEMVKKNPKLEEYIDIAISRVLRIKFLLGLFDNPYVDSDKAHLTINNNEAKALAEKADMESVILLKNNNKILPISTNNLTKIALVGPLLRDSTKKYFESIAGDNYTFIEEKGFSLTNKTGKSDGDGDGDVNDINPSLTSRDVMERGIERIVSCSKSADVIFLFAGGDEYTAREAFFNQAMGDRDDINPAGMQDELLMSLRKLGKPIVVILKHRRTLSINTISKEADAILDCWELSEFGDKAIAQIIFGEAVPSGKLSVTIPRSIGQIPFHYSQKEINYKKGYLFTESTPLYPFGFGLSYTDFEYSNITISDSVLMEDKQLTVSIDIRNTGKVTGKEVVQLYLRDMYGSVIRPIKELRGFQKIELSPGEKTRVNFDITPEMLEFTDINMTRNVEPGLHEVQIGTNSEQVATCTFRVIK